MSCIPARNIFANMTRIMESVATARSSAAAGRCLFRIGSKRSVFFKPFSHSKDHQKSISLCKGSNALRLRCQAADATTAAAAEASTSSMSTPTTKVWELDFCSRPILDERGKKVWELLICDPQRSFEYAQYFPNNKINSNELKKALEEILQQPGAVKPDKVKFFRGQMQTIISRALSDLELTPVPTRRCFALIGWIEDRLESVYKVHPGYSDKASSPFTLELGAPQELPDMLRGEAWSFVQLPLSVLQEELRDVEAGGIFGGSLDLKQAMRGEVSGDTMVPGVAVYSRRAGPLAAWTNSLELAAVSADTDRAFLILDTGVNQRWRYGAYRRTADTTAEAQAWEKAKQEVGGLHFLAIQENEEAEGCAGLWLLLDRKPPSV